MKSVGWIVLGCVVALLAIGGVSTAISEVTTAGTVAGVTASVLDGGIGVLLGIGARGCFRRARTA